MKHATGSILLVDDEAKIRNALAQALREDGHEVVATGSPRDVQRLLTRGTFDVLVVDNLMPELTRTRSDPRTGGVDAAAGTAADPDDDRARHG